LIKYTYYNLYCITFCSK